MQYFGGKFRIAKLIGEVINGFSPKTYYEPFCGGLSVTVQVKAESYILSDNNPYLITLYRHLQEGWQPPDEVDEFTYQCYRQYQDQEDPMTALVGIGCSFSGKWFGGYARNKPRNGKLVGDDYAGAAKRSLLKKISVLPKTKAHFTNADFKELRPLSGSLIYCDPPYQNTTNGYHSEAHYFWDTMRTWSKTCTVIVSEYQAPEDFMCIEEFPTFTEIRGKSGRDARTERLFMKL
jgi:DNA adenine methylase